MPKVDGLTSGAQPKAPNAAASGAVTNQTHTSDGMAAGLSAEERRLLGRLGAALVGEWNNLPMSVRRAIYDRAVRGAPAYDMSALKRRMARFLHDRDGLRQLP